MSRRSARTRAKQSRPLVGEYKFLRRPHLLLSSYHLYLHPVPGLSRTSTLTQQLISYIQLTSTFHPNSRIHQKCLPKLLRRSPPLVERHQPEKPPLRRKRLERRLPPPPATRRSATRPERRLTPLTSTKVRDLNPYLSVCGSPSSDKLPTSLHFEVKPNFGSKFSC